jgi:glycosyltransferase involved in cell wall biosynthesis
LSGAFKVKILYPVIDGEISGGNLVCLKIIDEILKKGHSAVVNSPTAGKFTDIIKQKGLKVYNIDTRRSFRLDSAVKLAHIIKKEGINLVHTHVPLGGIVLSRLGGWLTGVPVINHAHTRDYLNKNPLVKKYQFLLNWVTSRFFCARVIAVSEYVKKEVVKQGVRQDKVIVIYNGIALDNHRQTREPIQIREELHIKQNQRIIGEVGRLSRDKGQHILIKAAQKVAKEFPEAIFIIVGEELEEKGRYRKELEDLVMDLGLREQVIFTGYRADVMDLMNLFDIFVLPSFVEGLPITILEAMTEKKPVIATRVGGNEEIVIDNETGTLISDANPDQLSQAIIYHLKNPEISKRMGERGYERIRQCFPLSQMLHKIMDVYKEILRDRKCQS